MKYYVYQLVDSLTGRVFYIGKGQGKRMYQHEPEARKDKNSYKLNKIRSIWRNGGKVLCRKVALFVSEARAYEYETILIRETPGLTNACHMNNVIPEDTSMGRRMYSARLISLHWPELSKVLMLQLLLEGASMLTLHRQEAYMVKEFGL